jgi:hypothetical protein
MRAQHINRSARLRAAIGIAVVTLLFAAACTKDDPANSGASAASGTSSVAAKGGGCAANAYKDPNGFYCVVVPDGYTSKAPTRVNGDKSGDQWNNDGGYAFSIDYWPADLPGGTLNDIKSTFELGIRDSGLKKIDSADLEGGGLYERFYNPALNEYSMQSVIQAGDKVIECQAVYDDPITPDDACKTLRGM